MPYRWKHSQSCCCRKLFQIPHRCSIKVFRCATLYGGTECVRRAGDTMLTWVAWGLCEWALLVSCRGDRRRPEHTGNTSSWRETLCSGGAALRRATLRDGGEGAETRVRHGNTHRTLWVNQAGKQSTSELLIITVAACLSYFFTWKRLKLKEIELGINSISIMELHKLWKNLYNLQNRQKKKNGWISIHSAY